MIRKTKSPERKSRSGSRRSRSHSKSKVCYYLNLIILINQSYLTNYAKTYSYSIFLYSKSNSSIFWCIKLIFELYHSITANNTKIG